MEFSQEVTALSELSDTNSVVSGVNLTMEAALQGKPKRCSKSFLKFVLQFFCC
jgi:hypothetical protein